MTVRPVLLACLGNGRRGDDAAALLVARELEGRLPETVELLTLDDRAGALVGEVEGRSALIVVDAIRCADARGPSPGSIIDHDGADGSLPFPLVPRPVSSHGWSVASELQLGRRLGTLPRSVRLLGVVIASDTPHAAVSEPVRAALPSLARLALKHAMLAADHRGPPSSPTLRLASWRRARLCGCEGDGRMWTAVSVSPDTSVVIRSFRPEDLDQCRVLYVEGLLGGKLAENDTGLDIDDIQSAYMRTPGNHFWVAETPEGQIVGMIGVQRHDQDAGEIRRLRVSQAHRRRGIGSMLVETAIRFCSEHGYLKVVFDTFMEREPALKLFEKFRFRHGRSRTVNDKEMLYFYLDLYTGPDKK